MNVFGQLIKAALEKLSTNPTGSDAVEGVVYYNTASKEARIHNGTQFKTVVDTDTAQTLSNKEHDVATMVQQSTPGTNPAAGKTKLYLKNDKRLFMLTETGEEKVIGNEQDVLGFTDQTVVPSTPSAGFSKVYVKNSGLKLITSDGLERTVGEGGGQGSINYILNGKAEYNTVGWLGSNNGLATPSGTTTGTSALSFTRSTVVPLRETASYLLARTVASLGSAVYYNFTIDEADKGKVLQGSFEYKVASGTYADDELQVWIYHIDAINGDRLIQPAPFKIKNSVGIVEKFPFEFQTQGGSTATATYRLIIHCSTATATAFSMQFDNFSVGPTGKAYGSAVTDWVSYTPTGTWTTNTTYLGKYRKVGDSMEVMVTTTLSGAPNNASLYIDLPSGFTIDTTKIGNTTVLQSVFGSATINDAGARNYTGSSVYQDSNSVAIIYTELNNNGVVDTISPITFGGGDSVSVNFKVPIVGWSSSQVVSSDADTRVVATKVHTSGTSFTGAGGVVTAVFSGVENDSHGTYSISTGFYIVPVTGFYRVSATLTASVATGTAAAGNANIMHLQKAGVNYATMAFYTAPATTPALQRALTGTALGYFIAGDQLKITVTNPDSTWSGLNNSTGTWASFERLSGPSQIMASESVSALYTGAPPTGTINSSFNTTTFGTKVKDSHNAYSGGIYTVPVSGTYDISAAASMSATYALGNSAYISIFIDGVRRQEGFITAAGAVGFLQPRVSIVGFPLLAGQVVTMRTFNSGTSPTYEANASSNFFSITRTGQY